MSGHWLVLAAREGDIDATCRFLKTPAVDVNAKDMYGKTALIAAAENGRVEIVRLLLKARGIDVNTKDGYGSALFWASHKGHEDIVRLLLNVPGIDVNASMTALMGAALTGRADIVRLLLRVPKIDVNVKDVEGNTALMLAAKRRHLDIVRMLLRVPGIDVNAKNRYGKTALMMFASSSEGSMTHASTAKSNDIVQMFLNVPGIDVNFNAFFNQNIPLPASMLQDAKNRVVKRTRGMNSRDIMKELEQWTTIHHRDIQNARSRFTGSFIRPSVYQTNAALATYLSNHATRAPNTPRRWAEVTCLYRGIHGMQADTLRKYGYMHAPGFIATSRSRSVSVRFMKMRKSSIMIKLDVKRSIPQGTPWIWFHNNNSNTEDENNPWSEVLEDEVLLPPGSLFVVPSGITHERLYDLVRVFHNLSRSRLVQSKVKRIAPDTWQYGDTEAVVTQKSTVLHVTFKSLAKVSLMQKASAALAILSKIAESVRNMTKVCVHKCGKELAIVLGYVWNERRYPQPKIAFTDLDANIAAQNVVNAIYIPDVHATSLINTRTPIINKKLASQPKSKKRKTCP